MFCFVVPFHLGSVQRNDTHTIPNFKTSFEGTAPKILWKLTPRFQEQKIKYKLSCNLLNNLIKYLTFKKGFFMTKEKMFATRVDSQILEKFSKACRSLGFKQNAIIEVI